MKRIQFLRSHFFTGLLVFIPIGVIIWILSQFLMLLRGIHQLLPTAWQPESFVADPSLVTFLNFVFVVGLLVSFVIALSFLGWSSKQYLGRKLLLLISEGIKLIPVLRSVYSALDQLLKTLAEGGGKQFSRVVYVEFPRKGVLSLAFVTGPAHGTGIPSGYLNLYVPTTPNPTSGFHLIVPETDVRETQLKVEEAFKILLSLGIAQSSEK